jgi:hypothetical protein
MSEQVDHPKHYNQIKGVECIDVAEQLTFNLGNALKYIWRCEDKGNKVQDLKKAIWYLNREISRENLNSEEFSKGRNVCEHFVPSGQECKECNRKWFGIRQ